MTLSRNLLLKARHIKCNVYNAAHNSAIRNKQTKADLHVTPIRKYPAAKPIKIPDNLDSVNHSETARWSPQRTRDITSPAISLASENFSPKNSAEKITTADPHVQSYDCQGAVSLNSSMQTNVPEPYKAGMISTHYNMPGGSWEIDNKFIAENMRSSHYVNTTKSMSTQASAPPNATVNDPKVDTSQTNYQGEQPTKINAHNDATSNQKLSRKDQLKKAFKEYGATVIVFHVSMSLTWLGITYLAVSSGLDVMAILGRLGMSEGVLASKIAAGSGTFVVAYAAYKVFAPVRMTITLACTPIIVRYLRRIGFLKPSKPS